MEKRKRIWPWVTSVLLAAVAVVSVICCVNIYRSGSRPFTPEVIAQYAAKFSWLGLLALISIVAGLLTPAALEQRKALKDLRQQLNRYPRNLPQLEKEQHICKRLSIGLYAGWVILAIYPIIYFCNADNFGVMDINGAVLKAALTALIPTAMGMCLCLILRGLELCSIQRQLDILKEAGIKPGKAAHKSVSTKKITAIRAVVLAAALVMIVVGALNGGAADVLGKAIRICTECIGLG